jgi:hypothetical protein
METEPSTESKSGVDTTSLTANRKWTGRRRPTFQPRLNPLAARSEAAHKIAQLSDDKREYYRQKLEMRRLEHEQRMRVMQLEEQRLLQLIERGKKDEE